ncbi:MAG: hypothetical protein RLZZ546_2848 [Bacteroidota bacterium]|jgi:amidohydrolase
MAKYLLFLLFLGAQYCSLGQSSIEKTIDQKAKAIEADLIKWRRHLHQYPELSNREFNTMKYIAETLKPLGMPMEVGAAKTGVIALLDSGKPGPVIGLRADIDGLPVTERAPLPFASKAVGEFEGKSVGVMHACGHDTHVAILLATAFVLNDLKKDLKGKVVFVFQPAEEGAPKGEEGGAQLLIKEGLMKKYGIEVMFGLHISSGLNAGMINYKAGGTMAAVDNFEIKVKGKQTHGSRPWAGVDPIVTSAQIIMGLQTIISRQTDLTKEAAVITVGQINSGVRSNIIPEEAFMKGTIRTLDTSMQRIIHEKIIKTAKAIAESSGAEAEVEIIRGYPVTFNDPALTGKMIETLEKVAGESNVRVTVASTGAEDFSFYAKEVPGFFFFLGGKDPKAKEGDAFPHHTPDFYIDESGLGLGVRAFCNLVFDYPSKK